MNGIEAAVAGRVSSETIEVKTSQAGRKWAAFSVAVSVADGESDGVEFVRISVFHDLAERLAGELKKGYRVHCVGRLQLSRYRKEGVEKASLQLAAWKVEPLGAAALGRKPKPKAPPHDVERGANGQADAAQRDWQRPPAGEAF
jgi:single-stranded DNA-binding protein